MPVQQLLAEIRDLGYPGSMNLLCLYITQGRVEADRPHLSPRRVTRLRSPGGTPAATPSGRCSPGSPAKAVTAALTLPFHNGRTGGVHTRTKITVITESGTEPLH